MLSDQITNIFLFLVLVLIVLTVLFYVVVFLTYSPENPLVLGLTGPAAFPTPTSVSEVAPTYPATWTPTPTETPAPTFTPTETRTPTATSTPTATPTPIPTRTPTASATPLPTSTFTPVPSPTPLPYVVSYENHQNCYDIGMYGTVLDRDGFPIRGIVLEYGEVNIPGSDFTTTTDANGRFTVGLIVENKDLAQETHDWFIRVIENGKPASETFYWQSDSIETCDSSLAVQVNEINFRRLY
jgi:hypothetical protein